MAALHPQEGSPARLEQEHALDSFALHSQILQLSSEAHITPRMLSFASLAGLQAFRAV